MNDEPLKRRRLSDKLKLALDHALKQGRKDIAGRLRLIYEATLEEDAEHADDRRRRPRD